MKKLLTLLLLLTIGLLNAQSLTLRHMLQFPIVNNSQGQVGTASCWGWTDSLGVDYALVGNHDHVAFVRASDGLVLDTIQLSQNNDGYFHREMKTKGHYAYVVQEMNGRRNGLAVIDLLYLPDSVHFVRATDLNGTMVRSHNISSDPYRPYLYLEADEWLGNNGIDIVNISDPENPFKEGFIPVPNTHDMYARNDTVWVAEGYTPAFSIYDVTNKSNPVLLGRITNPNFGYCHNVWPSDDGKYFFTTEETPHKTVKVWDAHDFSNIFQRGEYLGENHLAHNVHVAGDLLYIAHYTAGVTVVDWSDPDNLVEIARYDTYPTNNVANFFGTWGIYPYTQNGYIYASNFEGRLFILDWDRNAVKNDEAMPQMKGECWPNPFEATTNLLLQLSAAQHTEVTVFDPFGHLVATLYAGELAAGNHTLPWHPLETTASGAYYIHVDGGETSKVVKMILQK
jgi:choice-of-anchor B domain-containing protein